MSMLRITKPETNERQSVSFSTDAGERSVELAFNTGEATVERIGNDLVFRFEGGSETRVTDFFVTGGEALPAFVLEDGTQVAGADVLRQLNGEMDLETAAGPGAGSNAGSGGSGEYADDAGSLIDGVGRLGSLGTDYWARGTEASAPLQTNAVVAGLPGEAPGGPEIPGPVDPSDSGYIARAVLYHTNSSGQDNNQVRFRVLDQNRANIDPADPVFDPAKTSFTSEYFENFQFNADGTVTATLKGDAATAAALADANGNLYDYITVTVDGNEYVMQVVVNQDGAFNSAAEDLRNPPAQGHIDREWHSETNGTGVGGRDSSQGDDEVWLSGTPVTGNGDFTFTTGRGNDTVTTDGNVEANGKDKIINLGADNDSLNVGGGWVFANNKGSITFQGDSGDDTLKIDGSIYAYSAGTVTVDGGDNDDIITTGSITAGANGNNDHKDSQVIITGGDGKDTITTGAVTAQNGGANTITGGDGDGDGITVNSYVWAKSGGANAITGGAGADTITVRGVIQAEANSKNDIGEDIANSANADTVSVGGMVAFNKDAANTVQGEKVTIDSYTQYGMRAQSYEAGKASNEVQSLGDITITDSSESGYRAVLANAGGAGGEAANRLTADGKVIIESEQEHTGSSWGVHAHADSDDSTAINTIHGEKGVEITSKGDWAKGVAADAGYHGGTAGGMAENRITSGAGITIITESNVTDTGKSNTRNDAIDTLNGAKNFLDAKDDIIVRAEAKGIGLAVGLINQGKHDDPGIISHTKLTSSEGDVKIAAKSSDDKTYEAMAVHANMNGLVEIEARDDIILTAEAGARAAALDGQTIAKYDNGERVAGTFLYSEQGDITLTADGGRNASPASALAAQGIYRSANLTADEGDIFINANAAHGKAHGILASVNDATVVEASEGDVTITGTAETDAAYGIEADFRSTVTINAKAVNLRAEGGDAFGIYAKNDGENTIVSETTTMVKATGDSAFGIRAEDGGKNRLEGGSVTVIAEGGAGNSAALLAMDGENTISDAKAVTLKAKAATSGRVAGMAVQENGKNTIEDIHGDVIIRGKNTGSGNSHGMSTHTSGTNTIQGVDGNVLIGAKGGTGVTSGVDSFQGGKNIIGGRDNDETITGSVTVAASANSGSVAGLSAKGSGANIITANEVHVIAESENSSSGYTVAGMDAAHGSLNRIRTVSEDDALTLTLSATNGGTDSALAMNAIDGATNEILSGRDATDGAKITLTGDIYSGSSTSSGAENSISTGKGSDVIILNGKMEAGNMGENKIESNEGDDEITINGAIHANYGTNIIAGGDGNNTIMTGNATAENGGKNIITGGDDKDTITIGSVSTKTGGVTTIDSGDGDGDSVTVNLVNTNAGKATITSGAGDDTILVNNYVYATVGGTNTITGGEGEDTLTVKGYVMATGGGKNVIGEDITNPGNADIVSTGRICASANGSENTVQGKAVTITSDDGQYGVQAMSTAAGKASNTVTSLGGITIDDTGSSEAQFSVVQAYAYAKDAKAYNDLHADGTVTITSNHGGHTSSTTGVEARAQLADSEAINTIHGDEGVVIKVNGGAGTARGVDAGQNFNERGTAENNITSGANIEIITENNLTDPMLTGKVNHAISTWNQAKNFLHADGDIIAHAEAKGLGTAAGLYSYGERASRPTIIAHTELTSGGNVEISAKNTDVKEAYAVYTNDNSLVEITAKNDITLTAEAVNGSAIALYGKDVLESGVRGSFLESKTGDITLIAQGGNNVADSFAAYGLLRNADLKAENGSINITAKATHNVASGVYTMASDKTVMQAQEVEITSSAVDDAAHGIFANTQSSITIKATESVKITATSESGDAYAMHASRDGVNSIEATGNGPIRVEITATSESGDAYAMYAGTPQTAGGAGKNIIKGSSEGDMIIINGAIHADTGMSNSIDTGAGRDTIHLNGEISNGASLDVWAGAGNDTLVLEAPDASTFKDWYGDWLNALFTGTGSRFENASIENITVEFPSDGQSDLDGMNWFIDLVKGYNASHPATPADLNFSFGAGDNEVLLDAGLLAGFNGIEFDGGLGEDVLHLTGTAADLTGFFDANGDTNSITGFETLVLDIGNSIAETVTLDDLLNGLAQNEAPDKVFINGDSLDRVNVGSLTSNGTHVENGLDYTSYTYTIDQNAELEVFIQTVLVS